MPRPVDLPRIVAIAIMAAGAAIADEAPCEARLTVGEAVRIASTVGLVRIAKVACANGIWEVEGQDSRGRGIEVAVDPPTGRVLRVARDE